MARSRVGGIINADGMLDRIVVTAFWRMRFHVKKGERLIIVPGLRVQEPVPWDELPSLVKQVEAEAQKWPR